MAELYQDMIKQDFSNSDQVQTNKNQQTEALSYFQCRVRLQLTVTHDASTERDADATLLLVCSESLRPNSFLQRSHHDDQLSTMLLVLISEKLVN